ncbi:MAG: acyl-CoA thioesterase [Bacteroidales bacterium]|nr:acyl-CoA thioesterase [Bacteroidales bacterium]
MALSETVRVKVRFSEVDPIKVVWHGNYVKYMEDAREAFGRKYHLEYMHICESGYYAPIYDMHIRYAQGATIDDVLLVTITYKPSQGAKLCFDYEIRRESDDALILSASTIQLFTTTEGEFEPSEPDFYKVWKESVIDKI